MPRTLTLARFGSSGETVEAIVYDDDGNRSIQSFDVSSGDPLETFPAFTRSPRMVIPSPDGTWSIQDVTNIPADLIQGLRFNEWQAEACSFAEIFERGLVDPHDMSFSADGALIVMAPYPDPVNVRVVQTHQWGGPESHIVGNLLPRDTSRKAV